MAMNLFNLNQDTRKLMLEEVAHDGLALFISPRLNLVGTQMYPLLLIDAINRYDDTWLANEISQKNLLNSIENRNTKNGIIQAKVPSNADELIAEGEFNRFYMRAICVYAINNKTTNLIVYRAKQVSNPRPESQAKIGTTVSPTALLNDLRNNVGLDTHLGLGQIGSGLSVKLS
jgi:hypothetical protein